MCKQILPSYPLFVKDPFFSIWAPETALNGADTMFWNGRKRPVYGVVVADGNSYCFMGTKTGTRALRQTAVRLTAFSTDYDFDCEDFALTVRFTSPLPPQDLDLLSLPVCFLSYEISPKRPIASLSVSLWLHESHCYDLERADIKGGVFRLEGAEAAFFGRRRQLVMSQTGDSFAPDWGYTYVTGDAAFLTDETALNQHLAGQEVTYSLKEGDRYIVGCNTHTGKAAGKFLVAFDDLVSVFYFGDWLKGYWFRDGRTIFDAIAYGLSHFEEISGALNAFDADLVQRCKPFGQEYLHVLYASLRQSVGAHKLVQDRDKNLLFLSKECHSNGCIATVDVSYPSSPLYLLYNPELVKGMLRPILRFAKMPCWTFPYAPHDAGTYPYCLGQTYSIHEKEDKYHAKGLWLASHERPESYPMFYTYPASFGQYSEDSQMPVEECGNMLVLTAAACLASGDFELAKENLSLLKGWADYLVENGLVPAHQLCTDDFASRLDKNANLSVKAIVGIAAFGLLLKKMGKLSQAEQYAATAKAYAKKWEEICRKDGRTPLTMDGGRDTFSLKYNLAFDRYFKTGLFSERLFEEETDCYLAHLNRYGTPLDSRADYTKSDWLLWAASLSGNTGKVRPMIAAVSNFLCESPTRVPFTDWFDTRTGKQCGFQNRTVQGGTFMLLLLHS